MTKKSQKPFGKFPAGYNHEHHNRARALHHAAQRVRSMHVSLAEILPSAYDVQDISVIWDDTALVVVGLLCSFTVEGEEEMIINFAFSGTGIDEIISQALDWVTAILT